jgi:hypothetical protein
MPEHMEAFPPFAMHAQLLVTSNSSTLDTASPFSWPDTVRKTFSPKIPCLCQQNRAVEKQTAPLPSVCQRHGSLAAMQYACSAACDKQQQHVTRSLTVQLARDCEEDLLPPKVLAMSAGRGCL